MSRAVLTGLQISAIRKGRDTPLMDLMPCSRRLSWRGRAVPGLGYIYRSVEQKLERQRRVKRYELPFDQARLGEWELGDVTLGVSQGWALKNDYDTAHIGSRIVLANNAGLPKPPDI